MNTAASGNAHVQTAPGLGAADLQAAQSMIGVWLRRDVHTPSRYEPISAHDIRRWANYSVGDDNPLWCDTAYGQRTSWGSIIAPPTFLYTIDSCIVAPGLPGLQWIFGGGKWQHFHPIKPSMVVTAKARVIAVRERSGRSVSRFIDQIGEVLFSDESGRLVSRYEGNMLRIPRRRSGQGLKYEGTKDGKRAERYRWTAEQIAEIAAAYRNEYRRGAENLYWEDVAIGDELPSILKGPLTLVDIVGFYAGRRTVYNVLKLAFLERDRHPANVYVNPQTGVPVHPAAGHFDVEIAHEIGMPSAYDQGWQRLNWGAHLITNWCGDSGFVREHSGKVTLPNLVGDLTTYRGEVVDKKKDDGEALVTVAWQGTNQDGKQNCLGQTVVRLPSRDIALR